jgi:hypothetical protein
LFSYDKTVPFSVIPLAFSAYVDEDGARMVNFIVLGDFEAFAKQIETIFSNKSFSFLKNSLRAYKRAL